MLTEQDLLVMPSKWNLPYKTWAELSSNGVKFYRMGNILVPSIITTGDLKMKTGVLETLIKWSDTVMNPVEELTKEVVFPKEDRLYENSLPRFIRYVRISDEYGNILPQGGLALCIELNAQDKTFKFSYALCGKKDLFNKKQAAGICNSRLDSSDWYEVSNYDQSISTVTNIYMAIMKSLSVPTQENEPSEYLDFHPEFSHFSPRIRESALKAIRGIIEKYYIPSDLKSDLEILRK